MSTAFRNLISNAVKYTHKEGLIKIDIHKKLNNITLSISDNGIGMQKETLGKLFKINSNVQTQGTAKEQGTGLGLILCHEIIKQHGGHIDVKSKLNVGSTFTINIPVN